MGKLPAFLFYPGDWIKDPGLRRCSKAAKGVWIDMLCLMFECPVRGVLASGDGPWSDREIAESIGGDTTTNLGCITELLGKAVARRNAAGAIFSARMVRDEETRQATKQRVEKHRSNATVTQDVTVKKRSCTVTENVTEVETETEFDSEQATSFVFLEVGLAGNEARMLVSDAVKSHIHNNKSSPKEAAEALVSIWQEYEKADIDFKRGVFKFFKEGLWKQPRSEWGRRTYTAAEQREMRNQSEAQVGVWRPT